MQATVQIIQRVFVDTGRRRAAQLLLAVGVFGALAQALDVRVQQRIILLLKKLQAAHNMSVLFITHDLGLVADIADHVIVMRNGTIIEQGAADVVLKTPVEAYTKNLLDCRPSAHPPKTRLPEFETLSNTQQAASFNSLVSTEVILEIKDLTVDIKENKTRVTFIPDSIAQGLQIVRLGWVIRRYGTYHWRQFFGITGNKLVQQF